MSVKKLVKEFYKSEALINSEILDSYLHPEFTLEWNSSKGFIKMNRNELLNYTAELGKAYVSSKARISHTLIEKNLVSVKYSLSVKILENPREEMHLANFMVITEIKDDKFFRSYQMSQLA